MYRSRIARRVTSQLIRRGREAGNRMSYVRRSRIRNQVRQRTVQSFRESYQQTLTTNATATGDFGLVIAPVMSSNLQITNYQALFEQYKILSIEVRWNPRFQPGVVPFASSGLQSVPMYVAFDPADNTAPPNNSTMLTYKNLKIKSVFKPWKMIFYPQIFEELDATAFSTVSSKKNWVDIANTSLVHHGLKIFGDGTGLNNIAIGEFIVSLNFVCRNQI